MKKFFLICCLAALCALSAFPQNRKTLMAGAVTNELSDNAWKDAQVGFGLRAAMAQAFYETGFFVLLEEKDEVREQLADAIRKGWLNEAPPAEVEEQLLQLAGNNASCMASAHIVFFGQPKTKMSFGVFHSRTMKTVIRIEVSLKDIVSGRTWLAVGEGESATSANSAVLELNERKLAFDKTNIGNASKEAVAKAVEEIMKSYAK